MRYGRMAVLVLGKLLTADIKYDNIALMRSVAIVVVILFHLNLLTWPTYVPEWLNRFVVTGFLGVDLFFFISGFVIILPYIRGGQSPVVFILHRATKILPSYYLYIAILLAINRDPSAISIGWLNVWTHALFVYNWFYATSGSIDGVLWSLATEVQFYVIAPFIAPLFVRHPIRTFAVMVLIANLWRFALIPIGYSDWQELAQMPAYLDVFAAGMLASVISTRRISRNSTILLCVTGLVAVYYIIDSCYQARLLPNWRSTWETHWRTLLSLAFATVAVGSAKLTVWTPLKWPAAISYNLYLWHAPIAVLMIKYHFPSFNSMSSGIKVGYRIFSVSSVILIRPLNLCLIPQSSKAGRLS